MVLDINTILVALVLPAIAFIIKAIKPFIDWGSHSHNIKKDKFNAMIDHYNEVNKNDLKEQMVYEYVYGQHLNKEEIVFFEKLGNLTENLSIYLHLKKMFEFNKYPILVLKHQDGKLEKVIKSSLKYGIFVFVMAVIYAATSIYSIYFKELSYSKTMSALVLAGSSVIYLIFLFVILGFK